jgi:uncharacterized protein (DUF885 family)
MKRMLAVLFVAPLAVVLLRPAAPRATQSASFAQFVDQYLDKFARRHPSIAAGNGIHDHDDLLEDFSPAAIRAEIAALEQDRARLRAFDDKRLTPDERADRRILDGIIDGWLLEQQTLENWKRNPVLYTSALTDGVHNLMTMASDPAPVRMRRIIGKLQHVPQLIASANANVINPPKLFVERGIVAVDGAVDMLGNDLDLAFASDPNRALRDSLRRAADQAIPQLRAYSARLQQLSKTANGDFAIGATNLARRYAAEELIDTPLSQMVAIGERELAKLQADFRAAANRLAPGKDPQATWLAVRRQHPKAGEVVAATQRIVDSLSAFVSAGGIATVPANEHVIVRSALPFDLGFASMHASPPLEKKPVASIFYVSDTRPGMSPAEQEAWLERFNYASLSNTAAHEAMPGHWLHSIYMRRTPGKVRRIWIGLNPFPQPSSGQDGWAHYAEQMVLDEGFANNDPAKRLAQLSDALTRVCRLLSGIKLHTKQWTLAQAEACFEKDAYVAAPAAQREAERGMYDPTYGGYFLGKMAILTLRADYQKAMGARFNLRDFHERFMTNGIAPIRAQRMLLLPGDSGVLIR